MGFFREYIDEPTDIPHAIHINYSFFKHLWPQSNKYRIVDYPGRGFNRYGLEAFLNKEWVAVKVYDNGCDDWGKLHGGRWVELGNTARWEIDGLKELKRFLLGKSETKRIINE